MAAGIWRCCWIENWFKSVEERTLGSILWSLSVSTFIYVIFRVKRRSGTLCVWNLLLGSNRSSSQFCESELTAEGQEHMKMTFSYEDNWIWQRLTLKTCHQQVTSHHIQICYLQSMKTTVYYLRYMRFVTASFVYIPQWGDGPVASFRNKPLTKDFRFWDQQEVVRFVLTSWWPRVGSCVLLVFPFSIFAHGRDTSWDKLEKREELRSNTRPPMRLDQILRLPVDPQRSKTTSQV